MIKIQDVCCFYIFFNLFFPYFFKHSPSHDIEVYYIQGTFLHTHIPKEHVAKYLTEFEEGRVYGVKNFLVITKFYTYKIIHHRYMLKFNYQIVVKEYKNANFPRHMYHLKSFASLT